MTNWYLCLKPGTLNIVDQFYGTDQDIISRNQDLEFVKLNSDLNPNIIDLSRNDTTQEIIVNLNKDKQELEKNELINYYVVNLRQKRDDELRRTDWIVSVSDSPLSQEKIEEWKAYRQALRDLPANPTDPENPVWPQAPTP